VPLGGAVLAYPGSSASFTRCKFDANTAYHGGAFHGGYPPAAAAVVATFEACTFANNKAKSNGGAVFLWSLVEATFQGSLFTGNEASAFGGAIICESCAKLHVLSSILAGNTGATLGGVAFVMSSLDGALVESSTFSGNTATVNGATAEVYIDSSGAAKLRVTNCIFDSPASSILFYDPGKLQMTDTICRGFTLTPCPSGSGVANDVDPQLSPLSNNGGPVNSMVPAAGSLAIDAGSSFVTVAPGAVDIIGNPRVGGGAGGAG
jgi:predicted outer membrane repeat protein